MTIRVECFRSVWEAIEDDPEVVADLERRSDLMITLIEHIREQGWTPQEAARQLDTSEDKIAKLLDTDIDSFSEANLMAMCRAVGKSPA
jgi:predicted XRE-type DNA-binding protein